MEKARISGSAVEDWASPYPGRVRQAVTRLAAVRVTRLEAWQEAAGAAVKGAIVLESDPQVDAAGVDTGYSPALDALPAILAHTLRNLTRVRFNSAPFLCGAATPRSSESEDLDTPAGTVESRYAAPQRRADTPAAPS